MIRERIPLHTHTEGEGPDLVLLHGMGSHSGVWRDTIESLSARWRVTCIDLPGHGLSPASVPLTALDELADALAAVVPSRAIWVGWSLGGLAALNVALRHPEHVARLVMVSSAPRFAVAPDWPQGITDEIFYAIGFDYGAGFAESLRRFFAFQVMDSEGKTQALRALLAMVHRHPPHAPTFQSGAELLRATDLRAGLNRVSCPVRFIMGERDKFVSCQLGVQAAPLAADSTCTILPGAGHALMFSHTQAFLAALGDALEH